MTKYLEVIVPQSGRSSYTYKQTENKVSVGQIVEVSFRGKSRKGVVLETSVEATCDEKKIKEITKETEDFLTKDFLTFIKKVAAYTLNNLSDVLKSVPLDFTSEKKKKEVDPFDFSDFEFLMDFQKQAVLEIKKLKDEKPVVLEGITGSGKTETYFAIAKEYLEKGEQVLILLPEISLTVQFLERFKKRFGRTPCLWHSHVSESRKKTTALKIKNGEESIVVGTRSALFLPFQNLKLIVVDEEHDGSYKQEEQMVYHARDMAVLRASIEKSAIILASATPSFETRANVEEGRYATVKLNQRVKEAVLPRIELIDLKIEKPEKINQQKGWISPKGVQLLTQAFDNKKQAMLFLNRRGYAPLMICSKCGHRVKCPHCDVYMVYHQGKGDSLKCHQCDFEKKAPTICPQCSEENSFALCGPGIERLTEEAQNRFPDKKILTLSSENTQTHAQLKEALEKIEKQEIDLVIGTQILAKGHHFPALSVVGIIDADMGLIGADFRASEKTLQLLEQTSGRAGREGEQGTVFIQTYDPDHPVMQCLKRGDKEGFIQQELGARKMLRLPPYGTLIALIISGSDEMKLRLFCQDLKQKTPQQDGINVYGPAEAPIRYLRGKYRKRFLVQAPRSLAGHRFVEIWLQSLPIPSTIQIKIDVDPYNFM